MMMTNRSVAALKLADLRVEALPAMPGAHLECDPARQHAARQIAVEAKRLWHEAQVAGLNDLAKLMEEAFYRAYQEAGGPKAMRAV
jgi:hypothetical protein